MKNIEKPLSGTSPESSTCGSHTEIDVEYSVMLEVLYNIFKEAGYAVIGMPNKAFAVFFPEEERIEVYSEQDKAVVHVDDKAYVIQKALESAKKSSATFAASEGKVICMMGTSVGYGNSYAEAALRATLEPWLQARRQSDAKRTSDAQHVE